jgi:hypothetical protein
MKILKRIVWFYLFNLDEFLKHQLEVIYSHLLSDAQILNLFEETLYSN